jgi:hypothetical protein
VLAQHIYELPLGIGLRGDAYFIVPMLLHRREDRKCLISIQARAARYVQETKEVARWSSSQAMSAARTRLSEHEEVLVH